MHPTWLARLVQAYKALGAEQLLIRNARGERFRMFGVLRRLEGNCQWRFN